MGKKLSDNWLAWLVGFALVMALVTREAITAGFSLAGLIISAVVVGIVGWLAVWLTGTFLNRRD